MARVRVLGVTLFDTAEKYGFGKSEHILGDTLGDERSEMAVATKVFPIAPFPPVIKQRARASARRLQLDRIPLYQIHQSHPVIPDSVIMPGMRELLDTGLIGAAGVSNYSLERWRKADAALGRPVISNQVHFSLAHPDALDDLVPFAERENRVVIGNSPLAHGLSATRSPPMSGPNRRRWRWPGSSPCRAPSPSRRVQRAAARVQRRRRRDRTERAGA